MVSPSLRKQTHTNLYLGQPPFLLNYPGASIIPRGLHTGLANYDVVIAKCDTDQRDLSTLRAIVQLSTSDLVHALFRVSSGFYDNLIVFENR